MLSSMILVRIDRCIKMSILLSDLGLNKQIKTLGDNTKVLEDGGPD